MDNKSKALGYLVGRQIAGMRRVTREPVAYLYNGVRLPKLPEWDREMYPYAFIAHTLKKYIYFFVLTEPTYHTNDSGLWVITAVSHSITDYNNPSEWSPASGETTERNVNSLMWSNFDMLKSDGSIALEASEPVPIYEEARNYVE